MKYLPKAFVSDRCGVWAVTGLAVLFNFLQSFSSSLSNVLLSKCLSKARKCSQKLKGKRLMTINR